MCFKCRQQLRAINLGISYALALNHSWDSCGACGGGIRDTTTKTGITSDFMASVGGSRYVGKCRVKLSSANTEAA